MSLVVTLPREYARYWIAREGNRVIEVAKTMCELFFKLEARGYDPKDVIIEYVPEEEIILVM